MQTAKRNPALTKDCIYPKITKEYKTPRARDQLLIDRGLALAECTARMRQLRK